MKKALKVVGEVGGAIVAAFILLGALTLSLFGFGVLVGVFFKGILTVIR